MIDLARVEEAGLNALQTPRQMFYDGWVLRLAPGKAKRARSVNAHFGSTLPVGAKIAHCERVYAARALPLLFRITPFVRPEALDTELAARGFDAHETTLVQTLPLDRAPDAPPPGDDLRIVEPAVDAFVDAAGELRGSSDAERAAHRERLADCPVDARRVLVLVEGKPVAAGLAASEGDVVGLFDIVTSPDARGRGHATAVMRWLLARAWERGARLAYLQVEAANAAALRIYARQGFATAYTYHYRARPGECR